MAPQSPPFWSLPPGTAGVVQLLTIRLPETVSLLMPPEQPQFQMPTPM